MKVRSGFVSNSSSSSFVILGVKIDKGLRKKLAEALNGKPLSEDDDMFDLLYLDGHYLSDDGPGYYGEILADMHNDGEDYLENGSVALSDLLPKVIKLIEPLGLTEKDIKVYFGTRSC